MDSNVRLSPRDFFLHLGIIVALYVSVVSLISLLFQVIDYAVGDNLNYYYDFYSSGLRTAVAALIIFFPAYLLLGWIFQRDLKITPEKQTLGVRRWLVYLTLFVAGLTIVIDLVVLLNSFLGGEITTSFSLKVLVVLVVAGLTFAYYILDLQRGAEKHSQLYQIFAGAAAVLVLASIVGAFVVVGSPAAQRAKRFDQTRINNLQTLQSNIAEYWRTTNTLPKTLADLNNNSVLPGYSEPRDPVTGAGYVYRPLSGLSYELCATFSQSNKEDAVRAQARNKYGYMNEWLHDAGQFCYTKTIRPADYPVDKMVPPVPVR